MEIKLTEQQLDELKKELKKEEEAFIKIPTSGCGWDIINCKDRIDCLKRLIAIGRVNV